MNQQTFCTQCGQPLNNDALFCANCGARRGANVSVNASPPGVAQPPVQPAYIAPAAPPRRRASIPIILIGILLILVSLSSLAILVIGQPAAGTVVDVEQVIDSSSDRMDYNYRISYTFTDSKGNSRNGSYTMNKVYNISSLPAVGSTLTIKYIAGAPFLNAASGRGNPGVGMLILAGLGLLLIILGAKGVAIISTRRKR
jgi:hypothetical protein